MFFRLAICCRFFLKMSDKIEFVYNTRSKGKTLSKELRTRLSIALSNDLVSEENADEVDDADPFDDGDDDRDGDYVPGEDASDIEDEILIEPNELADSDGEEESNEETRQTPSKKSDSFFYGKDGTEWKKDEPNAVGRVRQHNIMRFKSGPRTQTSVPIEVFKRLFTPNMAFIIITETNRYVNAAVQKWNEQNSDKKKRVWKELTNDELDAFIGILLAAGLSHNNMQKSEVLWRIDNLPIFRAAMSHKRFLAVSRYIRFDDGRTREFRQKSDKAAPIRDIWNFMNENLTKNYDPHENVTVDEQPFPYRGRTKFTQYIPSKPAKYGIKIWWACDAKTKYPLQGKLYTGKEGEEREVNQGENVLLQFANRYKNSGRTIIADNFFTTKDGVERLAQIGLSFVGTIRANKRCVPDEMRKNPTRPVFSTLFGFHENLVSICSYVPKKNKAVNLLSTMHYTKHCEGDAQKPDAILFYNATKAGVDCMDQMVTHFSCKRSTKRWTFAFFCNMLDVMALAAFCICKELDNENKPDARRNFLEMLSKSLANANIEERMNNAHIVTQFSTRTALESYFGKALTVSPNRIAMVFVWFWF